MAGRQQAVLQTEGPPQHHRSLNKISMNHSKKEISITLESKTNIQKFFVVILLLSLAGNAILGAEKIKKAVNSPVELSDKFDSLDPAVRQGLIKDRDLIVNLQQPRNFFNELVSKKSDKFNIAIYAEYLNTGASIIINKDLNIWPASLTKLPLAMAVLKKVENGKWQLDDQLVLLEEDLDVKSGELYKDNSIGTQFTIDQLLTKLLVDSDNTAYRILSRNLTESEFESLITEVGLDKLFDKDGKISAREYSRLLRALYFSSYLSPADSEKLLDLLAASKFSKFLSAGLPKDVKFSHKYGENIEYGIYSDSGIVYLPNRPYIISVMVEAKDKNAEADGKEAEAIMKEISQTLYSYLKDYQK